MCIIHYLKLGLAAKSSLEPKARFFFCENMKRLRTTLLIVLLSVMLLSSAGEVFAFTEGPDAGLEAFQYNSLSIGTVLYCRNQTYTGLYDHSHPKYQFLQPWDEHVSTIAVTQYGALGDIIPIYSEYTGNLKARIRVDPDTSIASQSISYDVLINEGGVATVHRVLGQVKAYKVRLEIYIEPNNNPAVSFEGRPESSVVPDLQHISFWFDVGTQLWDNAIDPKTGKSSDAAWNIPLSLYLAQINDFSGGPNQNPDDLQPWLQKKSTTQQFYPTRQMVTDCVGLATPSAIGDVMTLYRSPTTQQLLSDKWTSIEDYSQINMNSSLYTSPNNLSPLKEFQNDWWFRVSLDNFRPNLEKNWMNQVEATDFPSIGFVARLWYLQVGSFTYEQSEADKPGWTWVGWEQVFGPAHYFWGGVFEALGMLDPFRIFGPFQGLVETLFLIFCLGFVIWVAFQLFGNITGFHVEDYIRDLVRGWKAGTKEAKRVYKH